MKARSSRGILHPRPQLLLTLLASSLAPVLSHPAERDSVTLVPPIAPGHTLELGTIAFAVSVRTTNFAPPPHSPRVQSAAEAAGPAAREWLLKADDSLFLPERLAKTLLAPVAALHAALITARKTLPAEAVTALEEDLRLALAEIREPGVIAEEFLRAVPSPSGYQFLWLTPTSLDQFLQSPAPPPDSVTAALHMELLNLRFEPRKPDDQDWRLTADMHVSALDPLTGRMLYQQTVRYESGAAPFIDWTLHHSTPLRAQARTAYRKISKQAADLLMRTPRISYDAGKSKPRPELKNRRPSNAPPPALGHARLTSSRPQGQPLPFRSIGIISTSTVPKLLLQRPLTKKKAVAEAIHSTENIWSDDSAVRDFLLRIPGVNGVVVASSIPISVGRQTGGAVLGLTDKKFKKADRAWDEVRAMVHPQKSLSEAVLAAARNSTPCPVKLIPKPSLPGLEEQFSQMQCFMAGTLAWVPPGQTPRSYLTNQLVDAVIELKIVKLGFFGNGQINPALALQFEVEGTLIRPSTGQIVSTAAASYQGRRRTFVQWTAGDAREPALELERASQTLAELLVPQLLLPHLPKPSPQAPPTTLANAH